MAAALEMFRAECEYGDQARETVRFLIRPPVSLRLRGPYGLITVAAVSSLPSWARSMLRLPAPPGFTIDPPATVLTRAIGWLMSDRSADLDDHLIG